MAPFIAQPPWSGAAGYTNDGSDSGFGRVRIEPTNITVDFVAMGYSVISTYTLR